MLRSNLALFVLSSASFTPACGGIAATHGKAGEAGPRAETRVDAAMLPSSVDAGIGGASSALPFQPSNVDLSEMDLSNVIDEDVVSTCEIRADGRTDCLLQPAFATLTQSDQSKVAVYVVRSLKVEPTAHVGISGLSGNLPTVIVSLGDFAMLGTIDAHADGIQGNGGGFVGVLGQAGSGPGGGPAGDGTSGGGGGSYCGQGGQGGSGVGANRMLAPRAATSGTPEIVPLRGGASGGGAAGALGGAGGGALQLVAGGTFAMSAGSTINAGGGGGDYGQTNGGGGAGGSILIEATTVTITGIVAANGGAGASSGVDTLGRSGGMNGLPDTTPASPGGGLAAGGFGSSGATIDGASGMAGTGVGGGATSGGGGAGRIRLNSMSGQADVAKGTFSPALPTACVTQGTVK